jgi:hypothetical protein
VFDLADPGCVYELFDGGATIVLQSLHRFWPPLARFGRDLELALTHPVQVNAYITPPASRGLGVHHDEHDVFVLQVYGRKRWDVHDPDGGPGDQLIVAELAPGDCLYIPQRFPHAAWTAETASVHLTVGVVPTTWGDVLRRAVAAAVEEALSDTPLPAGYATDPAALTAGSGLRWRTSARTRRSGGGPAPAAVCASVGTGWRSCSATAPCTCPPAWPRPWERSWPATDWSSATWPASSIRPAGWC